MNTVIVNSKNILIKAYREMTHKKKRHSNDTEGASRNIINNNDEKNFINNNHENKNDENYTTLIVGPSFCGRTHLLSNRLHLIRLENSEHQMKITTRSPEQNTATLAWHENIQL